MWAFAFKPDSRNVSWRNFAISSLTRRSFRCFSSYLCISEAKGEHNHNPLQQQICLQKSREAYWGIASKRQEVGAP
jgi:hypothetical protein